MNDDPRPLTRDEWGAVFSALVRIVGTGAAAVKECESAAYPFAVFRRDVHTLDELLGFTARCQDMPGWPGLAKAFPTEEQS